MVTKLIVPPPPAPAKEENARNVHLHICSIRAICTSTFRCKRAGMGCCCKCMHTELAHKQRQLRVYIPPNQTDPSIRVAERQKKKKLSSESAEPASGRQQQEKHLQF